MMLPMDFVLVGSDGCGVVARGSKADVEPRTFLIEAESTDHMELHALSVPIVHGDGPGFADTTYMTITVLYCQLAFRILSNV